MVAIYSLPEEPDAGQLPVFCIKQLRFLMFHFTSKVRICRMHNEGSDRQNKPIQISLKSLTGPQKVFFTDITVLPLLPTSFVDPVEEVPFLALQ